MTSPQEWDPHKVEFPSCPDPNYKYIKILPKQGCKSDYGVMEFNARIIESLVVPTVPSSGPLPADALLAPKTFISTDRHSETGEQNLADYRYYKTPLTFAP